MTAVIIKPSPDPPPIVKMIVPGRRALGEQWREITVGIHGDKIQVTENKEAPVPPGGRVVVVPGMSKLSTEAINFLLEGALKQQEYETRHPRRQPVTDAEIEAIATRMWNDYIAQKLAWFKGQTTLGAGGFYQRETPGRTHWTGVH